MLEILPFVLGPVSTNCYLIGDPETGEAAVIDPAWDGAFIFAEAQKRGWNIGQLWYTHPHFDHFGGAAKIANAMNNVPTVALHFFDYQLWKN
jgi:glyoxylase-like metal-dependent hydrolase (beta-lactamase superfamily II)